MSGYYFVQPTDSLCVRGNLAFGDAGEHGAGVMPPPPSVFAGAFRSAMLGRNANALSAFTQCGEASDEALDRVLGKLDPETGAVHEQGSFRLSWLSFAGRKSEVEAVLPLSADLVLLESGLVSVVPSPSHELVSDGRSLPMVAVLRTAKQEKPQAGYYLRQSGWARHLAGNTVNKSDTVQAAHVHTRDPRLGIGLNADARTAERGLIYTTEGHAFSPPSSPALQFSETGFLVGIEGAYDLLPESGFLRLGGDGRSAQYRRVAFQPPEAPLQKIRETGRFRLILNTPGLFPDGWLPSGVVREGDAYHLLGDGFSGRLACAAMPRREVISGWDLFQWKPKDAQRVVSPGSVYWFDSLDGDPGKLATWVASGLWGENIDAQRRTEGYNLATLAAWTA